MPSGRNKCLLMESDDGIAVRDVTCGVYITAELDSKVSQWVNK